MNPLIIKVTDQEANKYQMNTGMSYSLNKPGIYRFTDRVTFNNIAINPRYEAEVVLTNNGKVHAVLREVETLQVMKDFEETDQYPIVYVISSCVMTHIGVSEVTYDGTQTVQIDLTKYFVGKQ